MNLKRSIHLSFWAILVAVLIAATAPGVALAVSPTSVSTELELRAAVNRGSAAGDIRLANDIALQETLDLGKCTTSAESDHTVVVDLAGHKLEAGSDTVKKNSVIVVPAGYTLTICDTSGGNKGSIEGAARGVWNHGSFTMTSGGIRNNSGQNDGNGLYNDKGGTAVISGGVIEGNVAQAKRDGAGVFNLGQLQMTGGVVQNNRTDTGNGSEGYGGGIYNGKGGNFTLSGGTIQGNAAERGAGVYNASDCDVMAVMGRARIQSNTATNQGGGIYNGKSDGATKLALLGGVITGNTAGDCGGGVANIGVMAASAGNISGNTAARNGGGIYEEGKLVLSGSIVVKDNKGAKGIDNDTYLKKGKRITVEKAFAAQAKVGIVCEDPHQLFTKDFKKMNPDAEPGAFFFANPNGDQKDVRFFWDENDEPGEVRCVVVIHYRGASGGDYECIEYEDATSDHWGEFGETTWFVARETTTIRDDIGVRGDVNLILCSGKTLVTEGIGIRRQDDHGDRAKLTIWNSVGEDGYLVADATDGSSAGIGYKKNSGGVGTLVVNGGNIKALGGDEAAGIGGVENRGNGPVTINNGYVEAHGGEWGAGIGGGQGGNQDNTIKIYGGTVRAFGGKYSAGIGGGDSDHGGADGGKVIIKNATVYAVGGSRGAGIGGGEDGEGGNVTIENSTVEARGGGKGAGIGGGQDGDDGGKLTVNSGNVRAYGGFEAAGIGGGQYCCGGDFVANGGTIFALAGDGCATSIGAGHKDYHEGTKQLYDRAKVTSSKHHTETPDDVRPADARLNGLTWHSVLIEPCDHKSCEFIDIDSEKHKVVGPCLWCGFDAADHEEPHSFNADHRCACGHVQDPILLKKSESEEIETVYVSRGAKYTLPRISYDAASANEAMVLDGWKVTGLVDSSDSSIVDGAVLPAGRQVTVGLKDGVDKVTLLAQWSKPGEHVHYLEHHEAVPATCEGEGNKEYWVCSGGEHPCGRYFADAAGRNEITPESVVIEPLGHEWDPDSVSYQWSESEGRKQCTGTHTCLRDRTHTETVNCDYMMGPVKKEPTCTEDGGNYYLALFYSHPGFKTQTDYEKTADALGHDWAATSYVWSSDYGTCTAKRVCNRDEGHEETETVQTTSVSTQPTCTLDGVIVYTAKFENEAFKPQVKVVVGPNPQGHQWSEPRYTWATDNTACVAMRTCANNPAHFQIDAVQAVLAASSEPTCTKPGEAVYTATFANPAFAEQTKTVKTADSVGHDWSDWAVVKPASCLEAGEEQRECARCGMKLTREIEAKGHNWGEWITVTEPSSTTAGEKQRVCKNDPSHVESRVIPREGHVHGLTEVRAWGPSCTEEGNIRYWICDKSKDGDVPCRCLFSDKEGNNEITSAETVLAPLGHDWDLSKASYDWSDDNKTCTGTPWCTRCGAGQPVQSTFVMGPVTKEATCTEAGGEYCVAFFLFKPGLETRRKVVDETPALGHLWNSDPAYDWSNDYGTCTATLTCERDSSHTQTETVDSVVSQASSTPDGKVTYTATFENPALSTQSVDVTSRYVWGNDNTTCVGIRSCDQYPLRFQLEAASVASEVVVEPTCTKAGETVYTATFKRDCFATQTKSDQTESLGHDWGEWEQTKAADCLSPGEEQRTCKREGCGAREVREVPAKGHDWGDWAVVAPPTETKEGVEVRTCKTNPLHKDTRAIPKVGHVHVLSKVSAVAPTCTDLGAIEHWACTGGDNPCGHLFTSAAASTELSADEILVPALGHDWGEPTYAWSEDNAACTATRVCKRDEGHADSETAATASVVDTAATCTRGGKVTYTARFTNAAFATQTKVAQTAALGHTVGDTVTDNESDPTCTEAGSRDLVTYCATCGAEVERSHEVLAPLGHKWGEWTLKTEATEVSEGVETRTCLSCGETEERPIPKINHVHNWSAWEVTTQPTCTADGIQTATCTIEGCGATKTETIKRTGHKPATPTQHVLQEAACVASGYAWYITRCEVCDHLVGWHMERVDPLGHDWGDWVVVKEPADGEEGVMMRMCRRDPSHTEIIGITALEHEWGEWVVTTPATETSEGVETRTCSSCGKTETRAIPATVVYRCVNAEGLSWIKGSGESLALTFKRSIDDDKTFGIFSEIKVDDKAQPANDASGTVFYTVEKGSLVLMLQSALLETLDVGDHEVTVIFKDGQASAKFTVKEPGSKEEEKGDDAGENASDQSGDDDSAATKATSEKSDAAKTGDAVPVVAIVVVAVVAALALIAVLVARRKGK